MRKISAHYIFTDSGTFLNKGILKVNDSGIIKDITDTHGDLMEEEGLEFYNGILCPGFVNAHCHLELSHLKGKIPTGLQVPGFIRKIQLLRHEQTDYSKLAKADEEMLRNGIVAVGDISNTNTSFKLKENSPLYYHTFIEIFGNTNTIQVSEIKMKSVTLYNELVYQYHLQGSITPHAPYSVSVNLFEFIRDKVSEKNTIISIHNQESEEENKLFISGDGELARFLRGIGYDSYNQSGKTSLLSVFDYIAKAKKVLLVHNTYTGENDIKAVSLLHENLFWVLCPNSNLYIEGRLPDIELLRKNHQTIALGTDSLASNDSLSILEEMKTISHHYPEIQLDELLKWATQNGAKSIGIDHLVGKIQQGKAPGINLITGIDFRQMKLTAGSEVEKLI
jgi:aminodeoxyfutalosine deaminase